MSKLSKPIEDFQLNLNRLKTGFFVLEQIDHNCALRIFEKNHTEVKDRLAELAKLEDLQEISEKEHFARLCDEVDKRADGLEKLIQCLLSDAKLYLG